MARRAAEASTNETVGRYTLLAPLGRGGHATVYLGRMHGPADIVREVAIKRLHEHLSADPAFVVPFLDEARVASFVRHANVLSANDVVEEDGELLIVMDYVPGESLATMLGLMQRNSGRMPLAVTVGIMTGVLAGLHAAHTACDEDGRPLSIVHRDVSPQNILIGVDGVPRVIDFGVAKSLRQRHLTEQGTIKGKLGYMAPEFVRDGHASAQSDVFSAAVVLWETLTNKRLFKGKSDGQVLLEVLEAPIVPPSELNPEIPKTIDAIVMRGLTRQPESRYTTALEMAHALDDVQESASATTIGQWLQDAAAESLAKRALRLDAARVRPNANAEQGVMDEADDESTIRVVPTRVIPRTQALQPSAAPTISIPSRGNERMRWWRTALAAVALAAGSMAIGYGSKGNGSAATARSIDMAQLVTALETGALLTAESAMDNTADATPASATASASTRAPTTRPPRRPRPAAARPAAPVPAAGGDLWSKD